MLQRKNYSPTRLDKYQGKRSVVYTLYSWNRKERKEKKGVK
jgi:hypothetical protein